MNITLRLLVSLALLALQALAVIRPEPIGRPIAKAAIPQQQQEQGKVETVQAATTAVQVQTATPTPQRTIYTSQGYILRILKGAIPTGKVQKADTPTKPKLDHKSDKAPNPSPKDDSPAPPQQPAPKPQPSPSSVYIVRRPESTIYQVPPPRPTTTVLAPKNIVEVSPTTILPPTTSTTTGKPAPKKRAKEDDADQAGDNEPRTAAPGSTPTTVVQSGDPWGDFVFPTRGPRPNWMSSGAPGRASLPTSTILALLFVLIVVLI
jgi:hypothetical protein